MHLHKWKKTIASQWEILRSATVCDLVNIKKAKLTLRAFIGNLPKETQEIVANKAAWKLLLNVNEDLQDENGA